MSNFKEIMHSPLLSDHSPEIPSNKFNSKFEERRNNNKKLKNSQITMLKDSLVNTFNRKITEKKFTEMKNNFSSKKIQAKLKNRKRNNQKRSEIVNKLNDEQNSRNESANKSQLRTFYYQKKGYHNEV